MVRTPLEVDRIKLTPGRLQVILHIDDARFRYTNSQIAQAVLKDHPLLVAHTCINDLGPTFASVLEHTSIPHLLEHLIIDMQVRMHADSAHEDLSWENSQQTFVGNTRWINKEQGIARIEISFVDDLIVLEAFRAMLDYLNDVLLNRCF